MLNLGWNSPRGLHGAGFAKAKRNQRVQSRESDLSTKITTLGALLTVCLAAGPAAAAPIIVGGSDLLTPAYASQLETWLGSPIGTLTNIFDHVAGDGKTSVDFHTAADGKGRTFSVFRGRALSAPDDASSYRIFGGYDPLSWNSSGSYNLAATDAERTAFVFNLSTSVKLAEKLNADPYANGEYQAYNSSSYGPTFGGGHDIYTDSTLNGGYVFQYSYGPGQGGVNILGGANFNAFQTIAISDIEVFTIDDAAPVPEPASLVLLGTGFLALGLRLKRKRSRAQPLASSL